MNATIILEKVLQILRYPTVFVVGVDGGLSCVADGGIVWPQGEGVASPWGGDQAGLFRHVAEQEGDNLPPGAVGGGAEAVGAIAVGDAVGDGPGDSVRIVGVSGDVGEAGGCGWRISIFGLIVEIYCKG